MRNALLVISFVMVPLSVLAGEAMIVNEVSVSASSRESRTSGGTAYESNGGGSSSRVRVYTEVNGEVVTDVEEEVIGEGEVVVEERSEKNGVRTETTVHAEAGDDAGASLEDEANVVSVTAGASRGKGAAVVAESGLSRSGFSIHSWLASFLTHVLGFFR